MPFDAFLELDGISKTYPGVVALDSVSFSVAPGEEREAVGPCSVREQHQDHGDDRYRADGDADRQREDVADHLTHLGTFPCSSGFPSPDAIGRPAEVQFDVSDGLRFGCGKAPVGRRVRRGRA